ncbi:MAG: class I SAM-dependent methyltransferase [Candidatus Giovannonibacteria bacterium]|nr:class I SAM-dependent methyltransferase [Candidatus Giovannonibacteria bacterium]
MEFREYQSLADRETTYFWHVGRREILKEALLRYLKDPTNLSILDIGCGTGGNIILLKEFGNVTGIDFSDEALRLASGKGFDKLVCADATAMPFPDNTFDLVSALDTIEHIADDLKVVQESFRVLKRGGIFLVTVPAYPWLWSQHDEAIHHVRRYYKKGLVNKLKKGGFKVLESSHFVSLALPINLLRKLRDKFLRKEKESPKIYDIVFPPAINSILLFFLRCEKYWIRWLPLPIGTSIVAICKKV